MDDEKLPADEYRTYSRQLESYQRISRARRAEQDRIVSEIEAILYGCKEQETAEAMVRLARHILDPMK